METGDIAEVEMVILHSQRLEKNCKYCMRRKIASVKEI